MNREAQSQEISDPICACCVDRPNQKLDRRRFLSLAGTGVAAGVFMPRSSLAKKDPICETREQYKALVLSCIDPRMQKPVYDYLNNTNKNNSTDGNNEDLTCNYSQITIAGAAIGAVAPKFSGWHQTFWGNLDTTLKLHRIPKIIAINHRGCGAATEAYGPIVGREAETRLHKAVLEDFRHQIKKRHPQLEVETLLMGLDGNHIDPLK